MTKRTIFLLVAIFLIAPLLFMGCGNDGAAGSAGTSAPTTGAIAGAVTDTVAGGGIAGVTVTAKDSGGAVKGTATTDATGAYSLASLPLGTVTVYFEQTYYTSPGGMTVGVLGGQTVTINAALSESATGGPSVSITGYNNGMYTTDDFGYGGTAALAASGSDPNGDTLTYAWSNATAPALGSVTGSGTTGTVTFPTLSQAMATRVDTTNNATISGYGYLDNTVGRFGILPILADTRGGMSAKVTVTDGRGQSASVSISLNAASVLTGARNVPRGARVYMNRGNDNGSQTWAITAKPAGSAAALDNASSRTPSFVADVTGQYTLTAGATAITLNAGTWTGVIDTAGATSTGYTYGQEGACLTCHNDTIADNMFDAWYATAHAKIFTLGVTGGSGTSGTSCLTCHTVGFDRGTNNSGFDDLASSTGWVFPTRNATAWTNMVASYPTVAKLANIQCENCHGPQASSGHMSTGPLGGRQNNDTFASARISYSAELCATCHASGASHNVYSQWNSLNPDPTGIPGHSYHNRANREAGDTSCARCHTAQGYTIYLDQLADGNVGVINNPQAAKQAPFASVTSTNAEPITCTACHDPHNEGYNPNQLRVYNDTPLLPAGFRVTGFGKGAICVTCHNTRNGVTSDNTVTFLHEDNDLNNPLTSTSTGHDGAQADVFAGRNAYFMGNSLPMVSRHAAVKDTCVGCHMALNPKTHLSHGAPVVDEHRFRIEAGDVATLCANCHSANVNGVGTIAATDAGMTDLANRINSDILKKLATYGTGSVDTGMDNVAANLITAAGYTGGTNFTLTYSGNTVNSSITKLKVTGGAVVFSTSSNMMKAMWNYQLINLDNTHGLHNPSFVQAVLDITAAQDLSL
jgi:hypothetical protein